MSLDDISFADLLDTCQAHLKRPRTEVESLQGKTHVKGRSKNRSDSSTTSSRHDGDSELLMMLAKLSLRQENILNQMALDRSLLLFFPGREGIDTSGHDPGMQGVASVETKHRSHLLPPSGQLLEGDRGADPKIGQAEIRQPGRSTGAGPPAEKHSDSRECPELPHMGFGRQVPSSNEAAAFDAGQNSGAHYPALPAGQSGRFDPTILRPQTDESRSDSRRYTGDNPMVLRSQLAQRRLDSALRDNLEETGSVN